LETVGGKFQPPLATVHSGGSGYLGQVWPVKDFITLA
jgi:hypothetical protein